MVRPIIFFLAFIFSEKIFDNHQILLLLKDNKL